MRNTNSLSYSALFFAVADINVNHDYFIVRQASKGQKYGMQENMADTQKMHLSLGTAT
jgi:hypothetical protein